MKPSSPFMKRSTLALLLIFSLSCLSQVVAAAGKELLLLKVPANTEYLWLVVMGAPTEHIPSARRWGRRRSNAGENTVAEWPYQIKLTGTSPDDAMIE